MTKLSNRVETQLRILGFHNKYFNSNMSGLDKSKLDE